MEIELKEVTDFLKVHRPFDCMAEDVLASVARSIEICYERRGNEILQVGQKNDCLYMIRKGAVELHEGGSQFTARIGEGGYFAYPSLLRDGIIRNTVIAIEDCLIYAIPAVMFKRLLENHEAITRYFSVAEADRLRHALRDEGREGLISGGDSQLLGITLQELIARPPVTVSMDVSVAEAARVMNEKAVTTVLVTHNGALQGILTDKDFRSRVIAEGRAYDTLVSEVMTGDLKTLTPETPAFEALLLIMHHHFHHIPVVSKKGELTGLVSASDIMNSLSSNAVYQAARIAKAETPAAVSAALQALPTIMKGLVKAGVNPLSVGRVISSMGEAAHRRLLELAEAELGPPPVPYALIVFGSLARCDQTAISDQDNGFIISDSYDAALHSEYFKRLAQRLCDGLDEAGYVYCGGDIMATNPRWRTTQKGWFDIFRQWINQPDPKSVMHATIFFDLRAIYGEISLVTSLQQKVIDMAAHNKIFLAHMVENAKQSHVPIGFFRRFVLTKDKEHHDTLDLKKQGVVPIQEIVRTHALANKVNAVSIFERLKVLSDLHVLQANDALNLSDALEFISEVRLRHQSRQIENGQNPDNFVNPSDLSSFEREHLRDAFVIVRQQQEKLSRDYGGGIY